MDAADIMYNMAETYAKCSTYADRGIVRHFENESAEGEVYRHRVAFKTYYEKPDRFYFEWAEPPVGDPETAVHRVSAFWTEADKTYRLFQSQPVAELCPSLDYVIAASAGISKGASVTVAAYLLPSLKQKMRTLFRLREVTVLGEKDIDGRPCYWLKGQTWAGSNEELLVDREQFLLRRTRVEFVIKPGVDEAQLQAIMRVDPEQAEQYRKFREGVTEERRFWNQIDYHHATVNTPLADSAFKFDALQQSDLVASFAVL